MRRVDVDWTRGVAVLLMIEAHTVDAWTRAADRPTAAFRDATILGGFAAPLFLWIAGVAAVLSAVRRVERGASRREAAEAIGRRGLEIFLLAFLFRLQAFLISPGSHPVTLFRVDILNVMGPSIAAVGALWGLCRGVRARTALFAAVTAAIAMATPIVRAAAAVDLLPTWLQWYLRPAADHTTFTLLPWAGFVFAGAACGVVLAAPSPVRLLARHETKPRAAAAIGLAGALLVVLGFWLASRPSIYHTASFWTSSPTWFAVRTGIVMMAFAAGGAAAPVRERRAPDWLERLGRGSLFIYWIHVELVYGYATWSIHGRLPLWGTAIAYVAFCVLMFGVLVLRDRLTAGWHARRIDTRPRAATA